MFSKKYDIVAVNPMTHETRVVYDSKVETFFLQEKVCFVWTKMDYTFDVDVMKSWVASNKLAWVDKRWMH
jgi:hypothetical protein